MLHKHIQEQPSSFIYMSTLYQLINCWGLYSWDKFLVVLPHMLCIARVYGETNTNLREGCKVHVKFSIANNCLSDFIVVSGS